MRHLNIYRLFFTKSDCYNKSGRQQQHGIQVHSTSGNNPYLKRYVGPDDGQLGKNIYSNYHNRPGGDVCASAYIGRLQNETVAVYQALPWDLRCWLSGQSVNGNANRMGYIGFEIAENKNDDSYFWDAVMDKSVLLTAHLCQMLGVDPWTVVAETKYGPALAVMDHKELHDVGIASNHGDITHWLKMYGLKMEDYRKAVSDVMKEGIVVDYIDCKPVDLYTLRKGDSGEEVKKLQTLLNKYGYGLTVDGQFGQKTLNAVQMFQSSNKLEVDGIVGPKTWAALGKVEEPVSEPVSQDNGAVIQIKKSEWDEIRAFASRILSIKETNG